MFDDGFPLSWPGALESAARIGSAILVPGHGDIMDRGRRYCAARGDRAVADLARRCVEEGFPAADAAVLGPYPKEVMISALGAP